MFKRLNKILLILIIALGALKPSFISAESFTSIEVKVPVSIKGPSGTVEMKPWEKTLKNNSYVPGPSGSVTNSPLTVSEGDTNKEFIVKLDQPGNYVYEIKQTNKTNENIAYDSDITGDRIYRFYITIVKDSNSSDKLVAYMEAEECNDYSCELKDQTAVDPTTSTVSKPKEICFRNEQGYWIKYTDGDHGTSDKKGNESGKKYDSYPDSSKKNTVTPNDGYIFTGEYEYVITNPDGSPTLDENGNPLKGRTNNPHSIQVKGNITFTPIYEEVYWVHYEDGDHGTSDKKGNETGKTYGSNHLGGNTVTPDDGYEFTGYYEYVITDKDGKVISKGTIAADKVTTLIITGNITLTPLYEKKDSSIIHVIPHTGITYLSVNYNGNRLLFNLYNVILSIIGLLLMIILFIVYKKKKTN